MCLVKEASVAVLDLVLVLRYFEIFHICIAQPKELKAFSVLFFKIFSAKGYLRLDNYRHKLFFVQLNF